MRPWCRVRRYPEDRDDNCGAAELREGAFVGLTNITIIYMRNNAVARKDPGVFRHAPSLKSLYFEDNKLSELPAFPERSCPRLTTLSLTSNRLTGLPDAGTFSACAHIQDLYLDYNRITYLHPELFSSLVELVNLYLHDNKIAFIPDQMFARNTKLRRLQLNNNRLTYLPQDFVSGLKQANADFDTFLFDGNPWHCACLLELLADAKSAGVGRPRHHDGTRPECVCRRVPVRAPPPPPPTPRREGGACEPGLLPVLCSVLL
ncbi:carboxypeptidase N subunit 2-like [Cydia amplana]|uniref:carboxypeptidase N subunit 2-like n=1 Tax=Cydia amplana TaxID=1869771 RepID=UPI002FE67390